MAEKVIEKTEKDEEQNLVSRMLKNDRLLKAVVFAGLIGIAVIFLSSMFTPSSDKKETNKADEQAIQNTDTLNQYQQNLCEELGNMIASIDGAGKTKIMLTMEQTAQNVYASDNDIQNKESSQKNGDTQNADKQISEKKSYIIVRQSDGSEGALTISKLMPTVKGVLVICEGGENALVRQRITEAVSAILDISSAHICVTKLNKSG